MVSLVERQGYLEISLKKDYEVKQKGWLKKPITLIKDTTKGLAKRGQIIAVPGSHKMDQCNDH